MGQRLARARKARKLNQTQLAELAGMKQSDISKIENGTIQKTTGVGRLASALGVTADWLELGAGDDPQEPGENSYQLAHPLGRPRPIVALQTLSGESWMNDVSLPTQFQIVLVDDALGRDYVRGGVMCFTTEDAPIAGLPVLLEDRDGNRSVRFYIQGRGGAWLAAPAEGTGYQTLESERDGLRVLAVFWGYFRPRA